MSGELSAIAGMASRLEPPGHVEVEHEDGGLVAEHRAPGRVDVARLGHHLEIVLGVEQHPQAAADDGMIVGEHHGDRVLVLRPAGRVPLMPCTPSWDMSQIMRGGGPVAIRRISPVTLRGTTDIDDGQSASEVSATTSRCGAGRAG